MGSLIWFYIFYRAICPNILLIWSPVSETTIFRPGIAFQFSHVNITVTDNAMTVFFKKKIFIIHYLIGLEIVLTSLSSILEITIMVR